MGSNFLVTTDAKGTNGEAGFRIDRGLPGELFENTASSSETIARLANADVEDEFVDLEFAHGICGVLLAGYHFFFFLWSKGEMGKELGRSFSLVAVDRRCY